MLDGHFSTQDQREQLLQAKANTFGSIHNDRVDELSELEYLDIEIKETQNYRRSRSMPFFAIGAVTTFFSFAANTILTQLMGLLMGIGAFCVAAWVLRHHNQQLRILKDKLKNEQQSNAADQCQQPSN